MKDQSDGADAVRVGAVRADEQIEIGRDANGGEEHSRCPAATSTSEPRRDRGQPAVSAAERMP